MITVYCCPLLRESIRSGKIRPIVYLLSLVESYYVTSRALGKERAEEVINNLINSMI